VLTTEKERRQVEDIHQDPSALHVKNYERNQLLKNLLKNLDFLFRITVFPYS
jgi:hypothetical protein